VRRVPINRLKRSALPLSVAAVVIAVDVLTKTWARRALATGSRHVVGPLSWHLSYNAGVSFSFGQSEPVVADVLSLVALCLVTMAVLRSRPGAPGVGLGLVLGGGVANMADRLSSTSRQVTDFIAVGRFPIFNVADAAITIGVLVLVVLLVTGRSVVVPR